MQVQGSACIRFPDGTRRRLIYSGRNGQPYSSIGKKFSSTGGNRPEEMSLDRCKTWFAAAWTRNRSTGPRGSAEQPIIYFFRLAEVVNEAAGPIGGCGNCLDRRLFDRNRPDRFGPMARPYSSQAISAALEWDATRGDDGRPGYGFGDQGTRARRPVHRLGTCGRRNRGQIRHSGDFIAFSAEAVVKQRNFTTEESQLCSASSRRTCVRLRPQTDPPSAGATPVRDHTSIATHAVSAVAASSRGTEPAGRHRTANQTDLLKGKVVVDARLDLHGQTLAEAHQRVTRFLHRAQDEEARYVPHRHREGERQRAENSVHYVGQTPMAC